MSTPPPPVDFERARRLAASGKVQDARAAVVSELQRHQGNPQTLTAGVQLLLQLGENETARYWARTLTARFPAAPGGFYLRGLAELHCGENEQGVECLTRARDAAPHLIDTHRTLAWVLHRLRRYVETLDVLRGAMERGLCDDDLMRKKAVALAALGRADEANLCFREGVSRFPQSLQLAEGWANATNYMESVSPAESLAAHQRFGQLLSASQPARPPARRSIGPGDVIRVGVISPDLRRHSVSYFARSLMGLARSDRLALFIYFTGHKADEVSDLFRAAAGIERWRMLNLADLDACERAVRADAIDLLIELSGLTVDHALPLLARRPAPVQATYIGYPNTTGVAAIDFRIVDSWTDPAAGQLSPSTPLPDVSSPSADALATERLVRLDPCFLCYTPPDAADLPDVTWTPPSVGEDGRGGRPCTFGSLNNLMKINDRALTVWKRVLDAVPGSVMLFKTLALRDAQTRDELRVRCERLGFSPSRIIIESPPDGLRAHLDCYNRIDVALDTFPYNGTTTTTESFLMGVPVIALRGGSGGAGGAGGAGGSGGDRHAARVSISLLENVGLGELLASTEDEYVQIAASLAQDAQRLSTLRRGLRARFLASPLCDAQAYMRRLERAIVEMVTSADNPRPAG